LCAPGGNQCLKRFILALIASIDITTRRIFLDNGVVTIDDLLAFWGEYRVRRRDDLEVVRQSVPVMRVIGGQSKGGGRLVGRVLDLNGYRIVPQDTTHDLLVTIEIIDSSAGLSGTDIFDRSPLTPGVNVNIDIVIAPVEIQIVTTGSAVTEQDKLDIADKVLQELIADHSTVPGSLAEFIDLVKAKTDQLPLAAEIATELLDTET
jgi:hypothetical protein